MNLIGNNALLEKLTPIETVGRKACRLTESVNCEVVELERVVARLYRCGEGAPSKPRREREHTKFKMAAARACVERSAELSKDYEENPLDDQEKLDAIRREVFGSAPNTKPKQQ